MARSLFVEGRSHDFGLGVAGHFGHLLGTLVDEQHDDIDFGMVVGDGVDERLHEHRLTRLGLCDDQTALPFSDRREEIDHAVRKAVVPLARQAELLARKERCHELELHAVADEFGIEAVDLGHLRQREIFLSLLGRADRTAHRIARFEAEELDLRRRHIDVVGRIEVIVVGRTEESVSVGHDFEDAFSLDFADEIVLGNHLRTLFTHAGRGDLRNGLFGDSARPGDRFGRFLGAFRLTASALGDGRRLDRLFLGHGCNGDRRLRLGRNFGAFGGRTALDLHSRHPGTASATLGFFRRHGVRLGITVLPGDEGDRPDLFEQLLFLQHYVPDSQGPADLA